MLRTISRSNNGWRDNSAMKKVVIASGNAGKLREFAALLAPFHFEAIPQAALGVSEAEEPHVTFVENALAKARHDPRLGRSRSSRNHSERRAGSPSPNSVRETHRERAD